MSTRSSHCLWCHAELPGDAQFCMACGRPVGDGRRAEDPRQIPLTSMPAALAQKVRAAPFTAERRIITSLFVDVVGSTSLAERMDPEDWSDIIGAAFDRLLPVVYRYEGTIAQLLGDGFLAFFGAPVAHEDDPRRAVRAALDLLVACRQFGVELGRERGIEFAIRVGVNTGLVVIGDVGSDLRYEYSAIGDAVNLAARMQAAARPMTVLISEHTYQFVAPYFDCLSLGLISVKGKAEPVQAYEIRGMRIEPGTLRGIEELRSVMVGRGAELAALRSLMNALTAGTGSIAVVVGEPGIGKAGSSPS